MRFLIFLFLFFPLFSYSQIYLQKQDVNIENFIENAGFENGKAYWTFSNPSNVGIISGSGSLQGGASLLFQPVGASETVTSKLTAIKCDTKCQVSFRYKTNTSIPLLDNFKINILDSVDSIVATKDIPISDINSDILTIEFDYESLIKVQVESYSGYGEIVLDSFYAGSEVKSGGGVDFLISQDTIPVGSGTTIVDSNIKSSVSGTVTKLDIQNSNTLEINTLLTVPELQVTSGAASGKVLTSDASGNATWQDDKSGGGSSIKWRGVDNPPFLNQDGIVGEEYQFDYDLFQELVATIKVPSSYKAGKPIKIYGPFYLTSVAFYYRFELTSTLIQNGTVSLTNTTNQNTSSSQVLSPATSRAPLVLSFDVSTNGKINGVDISPNDTIIIKLKRISVVGQTEITSTINFLHNSTEVTYE